MKIDQTYGGRLNPSLTSSLYAYRVVIKNYVRQLIKSFNLKHMISRFIIINFDYDKS